MVARRARMETTADFHARSGTGASPNSSVIQVCRRVSVISSKFNKRAAPCAASSHREAGSPEIVNNAIRYTASIAWRAALLDFEDFFFLGFGCDVDFADLGVGHFLNAFEGPALFVFADGFVLEQFFQMLIGVATDVAERYAVIFGDAVEAFDDVLATLLGERRDRDADDFSVVAGVQAQV